MISLAARGDISGAGSVFKSLSTAPRAGAVRSSPLPTMASSSTGTPALAICAAMPEPITPEPITATLPMAFAVGVSILISPLVIKGAP